MNILLVCESYFPDFGGVQSLVKDLAKELALKGNKVTIVAGNLLHDGKLLNNYEVIDGIEIYRFNFIPIWSFSLTSLKNFIFIGLKNLIRLINLIKKIKPDVVNAHVIGGSAFYVLTSKILLKYPLVSTVHGSDVRVFPHSLWFHKKMIPIALKHSDVITSSSEDLLRHLTRLVPDLKVKCITTHNGVNLRVFEDSEPFKNDNLYLFSMGRFVEEKGFDVLLPAFKRVSGEFPDIQLLIAGDGPQKERLMKIAESLDLAGNVKFLGAQERENIVALLRGCEFFVLPSRRESFPVSILESMATRKTLVATTVGGIPEIVVNNVNGLLVEPENEVALANAIIRLLKDKALKEKLELNSKTTIKAYDIGNVCEKYLSVYESVLHKD